MKETIFQKYSFIEHRIKKRLVLTQEQRVDRTVGQSIFFGSRKGGIRRTVGMRWGGAYLSFLKALALVT